MWKFYFQGILVTTIWAFSDSSIGYDFPVYVKVIGNVITFAPSTSVVFVAAFQLMKAKGSINQVNILLLYLPLILFITIVK